MVFRSIALCLCEAIKDKCLLTLHTGDADALQSMHKFKVVRNVYVNISGLVKF